MKKILMTLLSGFLLSLSLFAQGGAVSMTLHQDVLNGFFNSVTPITESTSFNIFGPPQPMTYTLSNLTLSIENGKIPFTGKIQIASSSINKTATFSGEMIAHYDATSKTLLLSAIDLSSDDFTMDSILQTLQSMNVFEFKYPLNNISETFIVDNGANNKKIISTFNVTSLSTLNKSIQLHGTLSFTSLPNS